MLYLTMIHRCALHCPVTVVNFVELCGVIFALDLQEPAATEARVYCKLLNNLYIAPSGEHSCSSAINRIS